MRKRFSPLFSKLYIFLMTCCLITLLYLTKNTIHIVDIRTILFWVTLIIIAEYKPILINKVESNSEITLSFAVFISAIILLGTDKAVWIGIISSLIVETLLQKQWYKKLFNTGQYALTLYISGKIFYLLKLSPENVRIDILLDLPAVIACSTSYILINSFLVSLIVYFNSNDKLYDIFFIDFKIIVGYFYSLVPISIAISYIYNDDYPFIILVMIPPVVLMDQFIRRYYKLHREARSTLTVLADIIDQRDKYTFDHSSRVARYSREIAEQLELSLEEISNIEMAGLVHDLGKISIEDKIIKKEDKLSNEEFKIIQSHPETGFRLIENFHTYRKSAQYILSHHERFGGGGYPSNISGDNIPLGGRILAVADSYDAMTSDRPYRKAMGQNEAVNELIKNKGTQFDPLVVDAFIEVLKNSHDYVGEETSCS